MGEDVVPDEKACERCKIGSCCYEGTELSAEEVKRVIAFDPDVPKPWFRLVEKHEGLDPRYPFSTIVRDGSCVFHDKNNRCMIYPVRPGFCREFPFENGKAAPYYQRLCILHHQQWAPNSSVRRAYEQREEAREGLQKAPEELKKS